MSFWQIDLTTRVGALGATNLGSMGSFVFAGLAVLGMAFGGAVAGYDTPEGMSFLIAGAVEAVIGLISGLRFRAGKGAFWGMAAAALLGLEMVMKVITLSIGAGIIFNAVALVCIVQGIRGALALRGNRLFDDDASETFE